MNKSNTYIFIYSTVLVALVATLLALAANVLKPFQQKNLEIAKKLEILHSVNKGWDVSTADSKNAYVDGEYAKYITESLAVNYKGDTLKGSMLFRLIPTTKWTKTPLSALIQYIYAIWRTAA